LFPHHEVSIRLNPGIGSGHSRKTNTGGLTSSFGIWHEDLPEVRRLTIKHSLTVTKIHTHIGAGTDPKVWHKAARLTLELAEHFPTATTLNLGGGFKVARMSYETATDLAEVSTVIAELLRDFANSTGRQLKLEIEPGTYLVANAGALISTIIDRTSTGKDGYDFLKLDTGLTEIMRPSLYGAQHPIIVINDAPAEAKPYVVIGHTCESGDLLTPEHDEPDAPATRLLQRAEIGDLAVIEGAGAYCASMSASGYNSFPEAREVMMSQSGEFSSARQPFTLDEHIAREL
jgi:diaminopimelate decarboxylase